MGDGVIELEGTTDWRGPWKLKKLGTGELRIEFERSGGNRRRRLGL